jgi:hypothetical protein
MDGRIIKAEENLDKALQMAAAASLELQRLLPDHQGVPHYSVIEQAAHVVGNRLSRVIQHQRSGEVAAEAGGQTGEAPCPCCGKLCRVGCETRTVKSIDGEIDLIESLAHCTRCERDFFPSADGAWL